MNWKKLFWFGKRGADNGPHKKPDNKSDEIKLCIRIIMEALHDKYPDKAIHADVLAGAGIVIISGVLHRLSHGNDIEQREAMNMFVRMIEVLGTAAGGKMEFHAVQAGDERVRH